MSNKTFALKRVEQSNAGTLRVEHLLSLGDPLTSVFRVVFLFNAQQEPQRYTLQAEVKDFFEVRRCRVGWHCVVVMTRATC